MSAEGNLYNPCIFADKSPLATEICLEFLQIQEKYQAPTLSSVRGHLFKMLHHIFQQAEYGEFRQRLASANNVEGRKSLKSVNNHYFRNEPVGC